MKVNYKCKDNDVKLQFHCEDGIIDEVWVQIDGEKSWTVVGYNDLINGIKKAESKSKPKTMKIYRIDGNRCFSEPLKGLSYHLTNELAEKHLKDKGFYLETRKWKNIGGHEPNSPNKMWYNIKLSDDGYSYDNTKYAFITEIDVNDGS